MAREIGFMSSKSFIAAVIIACTLIGAAQAATKVTLTYTASAPYMASFIAKDQGFFDKRGLDVDFVLAANGSVIVAAVVSDSAQIGTPSPSVFLQAVDGGIDVVALTSTNAYPDPTKVGVLARNDSNIKGPADLIGKKVGVPGLGGFLDVVFRKWLGDNGIDTKKITFVETTFPQMSDILKAGNVDAVISVDPFLSRIIDQKTGYFVDNYTKSLPAGTIASVYISTRKWATANPDAVKAFQEAIVEAVAFAKTNEASARESLAKYTKLPPPVVASMVLPNLTARVTPDQLKFWIDVMKPMGMLTGSPDPDKIVAPWKASNY
jgi:NitT/TauT family transport system substrate-binding protein